MSVNSSLRSVWSGVRLARGNFGLTGGGGGGGADTAIDGGRGATAGYSKGLLCAANAFFFCA